MDATTEAVERRVLTRYRRREIGETELEFIREKITEVGDEPRRRKALAESICTAWDWREGKGTLARRACSDLLLRLEEWGHIKLPPSVRKAKPRRVLPLFPAELISLQGLEICDGDAALDSLVVRPIEPEEQAGFRLHMERFHYRGWRSIVGEQMQYAAFLGGELVALLGWGSAALHAPLREKFIGWGEAGKRERLNLIADNVRFLVLPWVHVHNLASKILAANLRRLSDDWQHRYGHPIHLVETFVETRFRGTCYRASNWLCLGKSAGRTKRGNAYLHEGSPKALFVYPLHRKAKKLLGAASMPVVTSSERGAVRGPTEARDAGHTPTEPCAELAHAAHAGVALLVAALACEPRLVPDAQDASPRVAEAIGEAPPPQGSITPAMVAPTLTPAARTPPDTTVAEQNPGARRASRKRGLIEIVLAAAEEAELKRLARGLAVEHRLVVRAKMILLIAEGRTFTAVGRLVGRGRRVVRLWGRRFVKKRLAGLDDELRSGRPARFSP